MGVRHLVWWYVSQQYDWIINLYGFVFVFV